MKLIKIISNDDLFLLQLNPKTLTEYIYIYIIVHRKKDESMKKKIFSFLLIAVMIFTITGCGENKEQKSQNDSGTKTDERITMIENFAKYLDNGEIDKAAKMIDLDAINSVLETKMSDDTVKNAIKEIANYDYSISNIKYIEHNDIKKLVEELELAESYEEMLEKFKDYDFYVVDLTMGRNGQNTSMKDIYFVKKNKDEYSFLSSSTTIGIISYQYYAKENKPQ